MWACTMERYLSILCGNKSVTNVLVPVLERVQRLMSNPDFGCLPDLEIDYDLIEVLPAGYFFKISGRCFVTQQISPEEHGSRSPRCFIKYNCLREPKPTDFINGIENSFPDELTRTRFIRKLYQLLMHQQFPFKVRKLCVVGPPNSGKSTWFSVIEGIVSTPHIASMTKEGKFALQLINEDTEVVLLEEWENPKSYHSPLTLTITFHA